MKTNEKSGVQAVVPGYYLVCYNLGEELISTSYAVVPGYYLVCYNPGKAFLRFSLAVVPGYYLVCYNEFIY